MSEALLHGPSNRKTLICARGRARSALEIPAYHFVCCASFGAAGSLGLPGRGNTPLLVSALRRPPLGRPRPRRALGLAQVQDRRLSVRGGRTLARFTPISNIPHPLDNSP